VTDDHQTQNAMSLVDHQAATLLQEADLTGQRLLDEIDTLMENKAARQAMSERAREIGQPHATDQLIQVMLDEIKKKRTD